MKHFLVFVILTFSSLLFFYFSKEEKNKFNEERIVRVFAPTTFVSQWGPAPQLKLAFEKIGIYKVEFVEVQDLPAALIKMASDKQNSSVDVILGLNQYDILRSAKKINWRALSDNKLNQINGDFYFKNQKFFENINLTPYDWSPIVFLTKKQNYSDMNHVEDLLKSEFKNKIVIMDPKNSSLGLNFLSLIYERKSEVVGLQNIKNFSKQVHVINLNLTDSLNFYRNKPYEIFVTKLTSILDLWEKEGSGSEHNFSILNLKESYPVEVEFAGIPDFCRNCEAAEKFIDFLLSNKAQKILMMQNSMLPIVDEAKNATIYDSIKIFKTADLKIYDQEIIEKWQQVWKDSK